MFPAFRVLFLMLALLSPARAQYVESYGSLSYVDYGGYVEIIACNRNAYGSLAIPSSISGTPVTRIRASAFNGCSSLTALSIPSSVTEIGSSAFYGCSALRTVTIPSSVRQIGTNPFVGCSSLSSIGVSSSSSYFSAADGILYNRSRSTLYACPPGKAGSVGIPSSVTTVRDSAFSGCVGLTAVSVPASVTTLGTAPFSGCATLGGISVDAGNPNYTSVDGLLYSKDLTTLLRCPGGKSGHVALPAETSEIGSGALAGSDFASIDLPAGITEIVSSMFYGCTEMTSIVIPETVTSIGHSAFAHCYSLEEIEIPDTVSSIGIHVFYVCSGLTRVTLPDGLTEIGDGWFYQCASLSRITIPESVTTIADDSFSHCLGLTEVRIPDGVTDIGVRAFYGSGLRSVTVPAHVATIGTIAFSYCLELAEILTAEDNSFYQSIDGVLYTKDLSSLIQCPAGKSGPITVPASVTSIPMNAFSYCGGISIVRFLGDAPTLGPSAGDDFTVYYFQGSSGFTSPTWEDHASVEDAQPTAIGYWLVDHGLPYDSELDSDSNRDGVSLLLAYAFDLDPRGDVRGGMPVAELDSSSLSLRFYPARPELSYHVEASGDLSDWDDEGVSLTEPDESGFRRATVSRAGGRRFMRVVVRQ
ncbi:MAG: leucine-rich repeat domain-containing protein [Verrucomicrobiota bacterium JB025]|nr:leucine-rich repeat domain-containing protein [Verrucomicrobiota bacterium JB025]